MMKLKAWWRWNQVAAFALALCVSGTGLSVVSSETDDHSPLKKVADIPLPGKAVRFDYQSLDASHGRVLAQREMEKRRFPLV